MVKKSLLLTMLIFPLLNLAGCGVQNSGDSTLAGHDSALANEVAIKIESVENSSDSWILVAVPNDYSAIVVCLRKCDESEQSEIQMQHSGTVRGRSIYRAYKPLQLEHNMQIEVAEVDVSTIDGSRNYNSLKSFQFKDKSLVNMPTLRDGEAGSFELTLNDVYRQGGTNWCWAYAAYHTMKVYFNHRAQTDDPNVEGFRSFVQSVNSSQSFKSFMGRMVSTGERGMPAEFLARIRKTPELPDSASMPWKNLRGSRQAIVSQVISGLKRGIPSAYCYPGHCVTIYGFQTDGEKIISFSIADSANGSRSRRSVSTVINNHTAIWSLQGSTATKSTQLATIH